MNDRIDIRIDVRKILRTNSEYEYKAYTLSDNPEYHGITIPGNSVEDARDKMVKYLYLEFDICKKHS